MKLHISRETRLAVERWAWLVAVAHLAILVWACSPVATAHAQGGVTYVVQPGDTLIGIAARYGIPVTQLAAANGLRWNAWVYVGQRLIIPGATQAPALPSVPGGNIYVVQRGDTLSSIALRHGTTVAALMTANRLANPNFIYVGQRLVIPSGIATPAPAPPTVPIADYHDKWIEVDLTHQVLRAYAGQTLVFQTLVSTGLPATPTVVGSYRIYAKYVSAPMSGPGYYLPNVPYIMYFHRGYALHGTYWHSNFGRPMSHGCVNLSVADAEWLFNWAEVGTPVVVRY
ncbi:MAG: LysM peptidoglycan-binding domain-containing protein [Anaerolineae bacterium]|nr:LysM peptidoglycan-binding domain-containing protein [Anaerolineae bacterium]MDW8071693.1 LysM peptidoglycan-binding domain-containing protein [Anaerolineae bacterium]